MYGNAFGMIQTSAFDKSAKHDKVDLTGFWLQPSLLSSRREKTTRTASAKENVSETNTIRDKQLQKSLDAKMGAKNKLENKLVTTTKAKKRFLDNLARFQNEAKSKSRGFSFQRSYRKDGWGEDGAQEPSNFRRSYRPPTSTTKHNDHVFRQSLRKERISNSVSKFEKQQDSAGFSTAPFRRTSRRNEPKPTPVSTSSERVNVAWNERNAKENSMPATSKEDFQMQLKSATVSLEEPRSLLDVKPTLEVSTPASSSQRSHCVSQPAQSNAEVTVEVRKKRRRRSRRACKDSNSSFAEEGTTGSRSLRHSAETPMNKVGVTTFTSHNERDFLIQQSVQTDQDKGVLDQDILRQTRLTHNHNVSPEKGQSFHLPKDDPVSSLQVHSSTRDFKLDTLADSDSLSDRYHFSNTPTRQGVTESLLPLNAGFKEAEPCLIDRDNIHERNSFCRGDKLTAGFKNETQNPLTTKSSYTDLERSDYLTKNNELKSADLQFGQVNFGNTSPPSSIRISTNTHRHWSIESTAKKGVSADRKTSRDITADDDINYSVEEAINTFGRLSQEIDEIKRRGFRQSLVQSSRRGKSTNNFSNNAVAGSSTTRASLELKETSKSTEPSFEETDLSDTFPNSFVLNQNNDTTGVILSLTTEVTSQSAEKEEKRDRLSEQTAALACEAQANFSSEVSRPDDCKNRSPASIETECNIDVPAILLGCEKTETEIRPLRKKVDSNYRDCFDTAVDLLAKDLRDICGDRTPVEDKELIEMSVATNPLISSATGGINFHRLPSAKRKERLRQAVMKYRAESSSDSESLISDRETDGSEIDMAWLEEGSSDVSITSWNAGKSVEAVQRKQAKFSSHHHEKNSAYVDDYITPTSLEKKNTYDSLMSAKEDTTVAKVGNMKAIWEKKSQEIAKSSHPSSPQKEPSGIQEKMGHTKATWEATNSPISNLSKESVVVSRGSTDVSDSTNPAENEDGDTPSVGSMLSMWESKKQKTQTSYNVSKDEAFGSKTFGRLQVAKALFENMSKHNGDHMEQQLHSSDNLDLDLPPKNGSRSVPTAKSAFENKARPAAHTPQTSPVKSVVSAVQESIGDLTTTRTSSEKLAVEARGDWNEVLDSDSSSTEAITLSSMSSSDDERSKPQVHDVRAMWERRTSQQEVSQSSAGVSRKMSLRELLQSDSGNEPPVTAIGDVIAVRKMRGQDAGNKAERSSSMHDALPKPAKKSLKVSSPKSNIQTKISSRKKRSQRPMTQPITEENIASATRRVQEKTATSQVPCNSEERENSEEEKTLSFSERLTFFNQLVAKSSLKPERTSVTPTRSSLKRSKTQPVDKEALEQAHKLFKENSRLKEFPTISENTETTNESALGTDILAAPTGKQLQRPRSLSGTPDGDVPNGDVVRVVDGKTSKVVGKLSPSVTTSISPISFASNHSPSPSGGFQAKFQNLTDLESEDSSQDSDMGRNREEEIKATGSIQDRLKRLNKNQEEGWKKRIEEKNHAIQSKLGDRLDKLQKKEDSWKKNKGSEGNDVRISATSKLNITDRLNSIRSNAENWKSKTGMQNDADQFTVQAKIAKKEGHKLTHIISSPSLRRRVLPVPVAEEPVVTIDDVKSDSPSLDKLSEVLKLAQKGVEPDVIKVTEETTTNIPDFVDKDFENFFCATDENLESPQPSGIFNLYREEPTFPETPTWMKHENGDHIKGSPMLNDIGRLKASVRRHTGRHRRTVKNPVKALAARVDIKHSYTEQRSNVIKLEQQRLASRFGHGSNFTSAALAGLAHKADFSKVSLRSTKKKPAFTANDLQPWREEMLLRVKGRRHIQTRLVEPTSKSLNSGDSFLLILPDKLFAWCGEFSNVIEKAKVQEIADYIIQKGDLGSKATSVVTIHEENSSTAAAKEFWSHLGGRCEYDPFGGAEEDEVYEVNAEASVKTYKLKDSKLVPHQQAWGKLPTMGQLSSTDTYVFDFGAEMYIWQGKEVSFESRQIAVKLSRALWDQGYDYTDLGFCPFVPTKDSTYLLKGPRPEWGLFARVNENLETALVQEKFTDWSNISREIGEKDDILRETSRGHIASERKMKANKQPVVTSCNVKTMHENVVEPTPLILEGHNIRKGHGLIYDDDGRGLMVMTSSVNVWHATDKCMEPLDDEHMGIFHRGGTYVVRWRYVVSSTGKWSAEKAKTTGDLKKGANGRERTAYFMWTGRDSTVNEKGASALMATEIDKEAGAQVVVAESREPPAMRQCFNGSMVVMDGRKGTREGYYSWKLFCVRGSCKEDVALYQVAGGISSLRSRSSFVAVNARQAKMMVWHGCKSPKFTRELAEHAATQLQTQKKPCMGFRLTCKSVSLQVCEEGLESDEFVGALGRVTRRKYMSLLDAESKLESNKLPRAWHLFQAADDFVAREIPPIIEAFDDDDDDDARLTCFPFVQEQIDDLVKPALVMVESCEGVYLWQGIVSEELKGSSKKQHGASRRLAMETTVNYCKEYRPECTPLLIHEQHEPLNFVNSLPMWREVETRISFDEKRVKKATPVHDVLATLSRLTYTLEELRVSPLPEGIDSNHLETYLSTDDFIGLFEMTKEEFYNLPPWKQQKLRKKKNLF